MTRTELWVRRRRQSAMDDDASTTSPPDLLQSGDPPLPPPRLRHLVSGTTDPVDFVITGQHDAQAIADIARAAGRPIGPGAVVADVGCGAGRLLRHLTPMGARVLAGDVNPAMAAWVGANLDVEVFPIDETPPIALADGSVDVLIAYSVLTHLPLRHQRMWVADWRRTIAPGGLMVVSTHGRSRRAELRAFERRRFDAGRVVVRHRAASGDNRCAAFMPAEAAPDVFGTLEILDHREPPADRPWDQDLWTLRKPVS